MSKRYKTNQQVDLIGNPSIRILLLKTVTGFEKKVYKKFESFFQENQITDWWAYKLFGEYDLCIVLKKSSLARELSYAGTIEGIIYSTELLCYLWGKNQEGNFNKTYFDKPLVSISIIKIKPPYIKEGNQYIENALAEFLEKFPDIFCLGSFGWNEVVLIYPSDSFKEIADYFLDNILTIHLKENRKRVGFFLKTFTLVGINYNCLIPLDCSILKNDDNRFSEKLYPSLSISCRPSEMETISRILKEKMKQQNPDTRKMSLGTFDFIMDIREGQWGDFIENLIKFREKYEDSIFKTFVQLSGELYNPMPLKRAWSFEPFVINEV